MDIMKTKTVTIASNGEPFVALCPICGKIVQLPTNIGFNVMVPDSMHMRGAYSIVRDNREIMASLINTPSNNFTETPIFEVSCEQCHFPMFVVVNEYIAKIGRALFMGLHLNVIEMTRHGILIEALPKDFNTEIVRDLLGMFFDVHYYGGDTNGRYPKYRDLRFRSKEYCDAFIEYVDKYFMHPENYSHHNWDYLQINISSVVTDEFIDQLKRAVKNLEMQNPTIMHYMYRRTMDNIDANMKFLNGLLKLREPEPAKDGE